MASAAMNLMMVTASTVLACGLAASGNWVFAIVACASIVVWTWRFFAPRVV